MIGLRRVLVASAMASVVVVGAQVSWAPQPAQASPPGTGWNLVFSDDFTGTSLDASKWTAEWPDYNKSAWEYGDRSVAGSSANASVHDGSLWLANTATPTTVDGITYPSTSSIVTTKNKFEPRYGYAETRYRLASAPTPSAPALDGAYSCLWLLGHYNDFSASHPGVLDHVGLPYAGRPSGWGTEIDATERQGGSGAFNNTIYVHGYGYEGAYSGPVSTHPISNPPDWHTIGVQWSPTSMTYYVDGVATSSYSGPLVPAAPEFLLLQSIKAATNDTWLQVDYVKFWQKSGVTGADYSAPPTNYVANPIFAENTSSWEGPHVTGATAGWKAWDFGAGTNYLYSESDGYAGVEQATHGTMYSPNTYRGYAYQDLSVPNGTYTLTAYVKSSGGQKTSYLEAKDYGGATQQVALPSANTWTPVTIPSVKVTNGRATIGVFTDAGAGQWLWLDRVQFYRPTWNQVGTGAANVAVDDLAHVWKTTSSGQVWKHSGSTWTQDKKAPANAVAIAAGTAGRVTVVTSSGAVFQRQSSLGATWTQIGSGARNVANDSRGNTYVTNAAGQLWRYDGSWTQLTDAPAGAVAVAGGGDVTLNNQPITVAAVTSGGAVWTYDGTSWKQVGTGAHNVAVDTTGGTWVTNAQGQVWDYFRGSWTQNVAAANAVAIGAGNYGSLAYVDGSGVIKQN